MKTKLFGHILDNPVIPASGTFGFGYEFAEYYDISILGSISLKGSTLAPRYGNPLPRIAECPAGMINAVGLQNPGIRAVVDEELPRLRSVYTKPVILNIGGHSTHEYVEAVRIAQQATGILAIELNISCPNVSGGGMTFGVDERIAHDLVSAVRQECSLPLLVKLSPNVTDIRAIARAVEDAGADGVSLINTLVGTRFDLRTGKPIIAVGKGGVSGAGLLPIALYMVSEVHAAVHIPVVGMGGIRTAEDVLEMQRAGATAVMVGTENLINPYACRDIIADLPRVYAKYGFHADID